GVTSLGIPAAHARHADGMSPLVGGIDPPTANLGHPTIVLRRKPFQLVAAAITGAGMVALITVMALWRPGRTLATATHAGTAPGGMSPISGQAKSATNVTPSEDEATAAETAGRVQASE